MNRRLLLAILLVGALLAASCGSDDSSEGATTSTTATSADPEPDVDPETEPDGDPEPDADPDAEVELTASDRGVTADTITLGIAITDVEVFAPIGDLVEVYEALATLQNEAGGVGGREIVLETEKWMILDTPAYDAACVALTQDVDTFLIMGFLIRGFGGVECFSTLEERIVINTEAISVDELAAGNGRAMTVSPNLTDLIIDGLPLLTDELAGANVAVYSGNDEGGDRIDDAIDALELLGATVVDSSVQVTGGEDLLAAESELDLTVERWLTAGVEWVVNLDGSAAGSLAALQRAGQNDIGFVTGTVVATLEALGADVTLANNILGIGAPLGDQVFVDGLHGVPECIERVSGELGVPIEPFVPEGEPDRLGVIARACGAWDVFVTFAEAAGPELTEESFLEAGAALGEFDMTGAPSGSYSPDKSFLGNIDPAVFEFDREANDFTPR